MWWYSRIHRDAFTNAAILHHCDEDVDPLYHCSLFVSLYSVAGLLSFKENILRNQLQWLLPNLGYTIRKILLRNFNYVQCLNIAQ